MNNFSQALWRSSGRRRGLLIKAIVQSLSCGIGPQLGKTFEPTLQGLLAARQVASHGRHAQRLNFSPSNTQAPQFFPSIALGHADRPEPDAIAGPT